MILGNWALAQVILHFLCIRECQVLRFTENIVQWFLLRSYVLAYSLRWGSGPRISLKLPTLFQSSQDVRSSPFWIVIPHGFVPRKRKTVSCNSLKPRLCFEHPVTLLLHTQISFSADTYASTFAGVIWFGRVGFILINWSEGQTLCNAIFWPTVVKLCHFAFASHFVCSWVGLASDTEWSLRAFVYAHGFVHFVNNNNSIIPSGSILCLSRKNICAVQYFHGLWMVELGAFKWSAFYTVLTDKSLLSQK